MAEKLGPYTLERRIGTGGMADVFLARGPQGTCVIKRPHASLCSNAEFVRMFLDEAALLARLHHPGIAQIFDLGHVGDVYYLAMEYVPGFDLMTISLEHERQGELMAPELCARIIADAARALHSAHEAKADDGTPLALVHRDVTPHNILLSTRGEVKVIDFGVARASTATHRTQAGFVKGKYPYMAPEQIVDAHIDRRVDVYALGLVLYELLTNVRAIAGQTEVEQIDNARAARVRPIEQLRPNTPIPLRQIVASCLYPDPDGRYPTALALAEDLEKYLAYEHHVVGQEDLLRLFRVVAAEAASVGTTQPVPPVSEDELWLRRRPTEQDQRMSPLVVPEGATTLPPDDLSLGAANTLPSLQVAAATPMKLHRPQELEGQAVTLQNPIVQPKSMLGPLRIAVVVLLAVAGGLAGLLWHGEPAVVTAVDAGVPTPVVTRFAFPEDAGTEAADDEFEEDAGDQVVGEELDGGLGELATLRVTAEPASDVTLEPARATAPPGRTPVSWEVPEGTYSVRFINRAEGLRRQLPVVLKAGEKRQLNLVARKGTLRISVSPFAMMVLDGQPLAPQQKSFHELELWDGRHDLELTLTDPSLPAPRRKKLRLTIEAGKVNDVKVQMLTD